MPRESIAITLEESAEFLAAQDWVVLATLEPDGSPWADVVPSIMFDGRLYFRVSAHSRSGRNIRRDARVCCTQDQNPSYYEIKGVMVHGTAKSLTPEGTPPALLEMSDPLLPNDRSASDSYSIELTDVASFDFRKIKGR